MDQTKRKYPPAVERYRKSHPILSVVLTKDLKNCLDSLRTEYTVEKKSYSKIIKELIKNTLELTEEIRLDKETLSLLNECKAIEAERRGVSYMKHDVFIRFAFRLYKKNVMRDECRVVLYLTGKEEIE